MNLFNDLKVAIQQDLACIGVAFPSDATVEDLLVLFYTYKFKTIKSAPRNVYQSREFQTALNSCNPQQKQAMADIIAKFQNGVDVNGHLSKDSVKPVKADGLLYDWGVYHLHVSNTKTNRSQRFFDRTGPVALVKVTESDAYFIDIREHSPQMNPLLWTQQDILKIVEDNWPSLHDSVSINAISTAFQPSDSDLKTLRGQPGTGEGAINVILSVGGKIIVPPGGGMATDGTPISVMRAVDTTQFAVKDIEQFLMQNSNAIKSELESQINVAVADQDFELVRDGASWTIREKTSQHIIAIEPLSPLYGKLPALP